MKNLLLILVVYLCYGCKSYSSKKVILSEKEEIILYTESEGFVWGMDMKMSGSIDGEADLIISHCGGPYHSVRLKKGIIDYKFKQDWYCDSLFILYKPIDSKKAELLIEYDFLK